MGTVAFVSHSAMIVLTLVDLAEHHNTGELGLWVVWDLRVEGEDAHATTILGGHIFERFLDQHGGFVDDLLYGLSMSTDEAPL